MLRQDIQDQMKTAMKARDKVRLDAIKYLWSQVRYQEIDKKADLTDEEITKLLRTEIKKRREVVDQMKSAGRDELALEEIAKLSVLEEFVEEMSDEAIAAAVDQVVNSGINDFGAAMREVMGLTQGKADGKKVSELVKQKLVSDN